jgi:hypothetical protein
VSQPCTRASADPGHTTSAALIVDPAGTTDRLLVASGGGTSVSGAAHTVITGVEDAQQRTMVVEDLVPLQPGDGRGLIGFYLVIGWIVGGYLVAALLGVSAGSRPATTRRAIFRLGALVPIVHVGDRGATRSCPGCAAPSSSTPCSALSPVISPRSGRSPRCWCSPQER